MFTLGPLEHIPLNFNWHVVLYILEVKWSRGLVEVRTNGHRSHIASEGAIQVGRVAAPTIRCCVIHKSSF